MDLYNYYQLLFKVTQSEKITITEFENLIPFERELYLNFLNEKKE